MEWPQKTRDIHNHHMDSTRWDGFKFRDDDIIIATYAKAGTTWTQQIIGQLIFNGDPEVQTETLSPWLDVRILPLDEIMAGLEAQQHRRFIKTHLPVDALVFHPQAKYIYLTRDAPDIVWSMHNHLFRATDEFFDVFNNTPGLVGPRLQRPDPDVYQFWQEFIEKDGYPLWAFWENVRSWWEIRHLPNVKLLHFNDLKRDMEGEICGIAEFLEIEIDTASWPVVFEHCTFDWMKANAERVSPVGGVMWEGGAATFIHKGENRRWKDALSDRDIEEYRSLAVTKLGQECAEWLFDGKRV